LPFYRAKREIPRRSAPRNDAFSAFFRSPFNRAENVAKIIRLLPLRFGFAFEHECEQDANTLKAFTEISTLKSEISNLKFEIFPSASQRIAELKSIFEITGTR
jgi:hypothetical protein